MTSAPAAAQAAQETSKVAAGLPPPVEPRPEGQGDEEAAARARASERLAHGHEQRQQARRRRELTPFLWDEKLDGTNNAAERALRPAVVMRKVTGGSRSEAGAHAWAVLASVLRTADQQGRDAVQTLKELMIRHWADEPGLLTRD